MSNRLIFIYILLGVGLLNYQSCAPSGETLSQDSSEVTVIDSISVGGISFPQNKVSATLDQNVVVHGVCDQSGALISWKLLSSDGSLIERGLADCDLGAFSLQLSDQWQSHCGEILNLEAALGAKASSVTQVEANCQ